MGGQILAYSQLCSPRTQTYGVTPANAAIAPSTMPPRILDRSERLRGLAVVSGIGNGEALVSDMSARGKEVNERAGCL